jgi:ppGpp synthetase/RelA/SpoT-type nucleotidyltranferase
MKKPDSIDEYIIWAEREIACQFNDPKIQKLYDTNLITVFNTVIQHPFFIGFSNKAKEWEDYYEGKTHTSLFMDNSNPNLTKKPYKSVVEKTYRHNLLWNKGFPSPPKNGWYTFQNLYSRLNDLVRGTLVCRFIDGPSFIADRIQRYAEEHRLTCRQYSQEREDGYYAFHVYVSFPVTIIDSDWNEENIFVEVEIQVTTQLQEVLRTLTHKFYESQRLSVSNDKGKWKWDFSSSRFRVGYLSHTLHLLESIILESRENVLGGGLGRIEDEEND